MTTPFTPEQHAWFLETFGTGSNRETQDGKNVGTPSLDGTSIQEEGLRTRIPPTK